MHSEYGRYFRALVMTLALLLLASPTLLAGQKKPSKDTVAVVNGVEISRADFDAEISRARQQLAGLNMQRDAHDFMRFLFYFWSFAEIADIYFV